MSYIELQAVNGPLGNTTSCIPWQQQGYGSICTSIAPTYVTTPNTVAQVETLLRDIKTDMLIELAARLKNELGKRRTAALADAAKIDSVIDP